MSNYLLRKNFTAIFQNQKETIRGKLAFKTELTHWLDTDHPVIALVSVHSAFHKCIDGDLKMNAFMSTIKNCVKGKVTVLLSDRAHLKTCSLKYQHDVEKAFEFCLKSAQDLNVRYQAYFETCQVVFWHSYINQDKSFIPALNFVKRLFQEDLIFRDYLLKDAETCYTAERMEACGSKELFLEKTREDLLEQCASILVLSHKGYRFQFYPGRACLSTAYLSAACLPEEKRITWVDVFLSIEKKIVLS